jgi:hypothetical protein
MKASPIRKSQLSALERHLVEVMQEANHACIENLLVRDGEPVFTDDTRVIRKIKLGGGDNSPRRELVQTDTELKREIVELFDHLRRVGDGTVSSLIVAAGLPRHLEVVDNRRAASR